MLGAESAATALEMLRVLLRDPDPTPASEERDRAGGYDVGMLALNSVRGGATTAAIELLLAAVRLRDADLRGQVARLLIEHVASDVAVSVRAAVGILLPWLLAHDLDNLSRWRVILFGPAVQADVRVATFAAYLSYSRVFRDTVERIADEYVRALAELRADTEDERTHGRDPREMLGVHVAYAHLVNVLAAVDGHWLTTYYARGPEWALARTSRWIAEQIGDPGAAAGVHDVARAFLEERIASPEAADPELEAMSWLSRKTDRPVEDLVRIILPALERTGGRAADETGVAGLIARCSESVPLEAARALELLVAGDRWRSLPHIASSELREALVVLREKDANTREVVARVVNTLSEQGFYEYRELLP